MDVTEEGELLGYGSVYYHPKVAANVLSFYNMSRRFKSMTFNNRERNAFLVMRDDGSFIEFVPSSEGLYYYDSNNSINRIKQSPQRTMIVEAVEEIKRKYTKREIEQADRVRRLYVILGRPSRESFEMIIKKGRILNNPVTVSDYRNAENICGKDLGALKGKTVRQKPSHVVVETRNSPVDKQMIVLSVDLMHFLGVTFLVTVSRNVRFITAAMLLDRKKKTIWNSLRHVINVYRSKGHTIEEVELIEREHEIHTILADNEFELLRQDIEEYGPKVNISSKEEHVPEVEHQNRVIKERARGIIQTLPYRYIPKKMKLVLIQYIVFWLNLIPKDGQEYSPKEIICGEQKIDYKVLCKIPFGAYVQVHDDLEVTSTMQP